MFTISKLKELSFLVYGLGLSGKSIVRFFIRNKIIKFKVWDDKEKKIYKKRQTSNLLQTLKDVDFIVLSPGISLIDKKNLQKFKKKIITDVDFFYLTNKVSKSIVVTGTNGKSTTSKIIYHLLKKNKFKVTLGGNIGTPLLDLKIKKDTYVVIELSSFQLSHSKFIKPDYAILLNITNDHLDWHGSMLNYKNSKLKIFQLQDKKQFSLINKKFEKNFKNKKFCGKLFLPNNKKYKYLKPRIKNPYFETSINDENMGFVYTLSRLLKISEKNFTKAMETFRGLPHRYEIFLKIRNIIFVNDSKATSFEATKYALLNSRNIYWILGGLHKKNDKISLMGLTKNIIKGYIIGKNSNYFKKQLKNKIDFAVPINLKNAIYQILSDIQSQNKNYNTILFSPSAASFDQYLNFEKRGEEFKKLSKFYARKFF